MLLPEIDTKRTRKNVAALLEQYHSLRRLAGEQYEQKMTANYTLEPKGSGGISRPIENMVTRKIAAMQIITNIHDALARLSSQERKILWDHYTVSVPNEHEIVTNYNMSVATYYRKLENAQYSFAEVYAGGELLVDKDNCF